MNLIFYIVSIFLIFSHSSIIFSSIDKYEFFNNSEETVNQNKLSENKPADVVDIKWGDEQVTEVINNSSGDQDSNTDAAKSDNTFVEWFSESEEPSILKTHKIKTSFSKGDPYYGKNLCGNGTYTCIMLKKNDTWNSLFPNKYQRELVQRVNRTNKGLWNRNWILVPNNINSDYMDFSPLPNYRNTDGKKTIVVDISELAFGAYDRDGDLLHWGPINPGKTASKTVRGTNFKIYRKGGADCWSKKFESYMPYCMFFYEGFALHGFSMPGFPASHGCVRMYIDDALWLNKNFADYNTRVIVQD